MAERAGLENYNFLPRLRIKKIISGYRMSNEDRHELQLLLFHHNRLVRENSILFEVSQFCEHFS
jgi:hypothetical protein